MILAAGQQLDNLGGLVGEPRSGRDDATYLIGIRARISLNVGGGTIENIIELMIAVANAPHTIALREYHPAAFIANIVEPINTLLTEPARMAAFLKTGKGGGVKGVLTYHVAGAFQYDGPVGSGFDDGKYGGAG